MSTKQRTAGYRAGHQQRTPSARPTKVQAATPASWQTKLDQYLAKAQTWAAAGDLVEAENCYQHAEHYFRMLRSGAARA